MKVKLKSGKEVSWHPVANCTGYNADEITLDHRDLMILARLSPEHLSAVVFQLSNRVRRMPAPGDTGTQ